MTYAIILSTNDVSMDSGSSVEVGVTLDSLEDLVVNVSVNNSNVTVYPTSITFTSDNYNIVQNITITGSSAVDSNLSSVVTLSADGLVNKTVSVTLNEIPLTSLSSGDNTIVSGSSYGGTHTDARLVYSDAGTLDFSLVNLDMTYDKTYIYAFFGTELAASVVIRIFDTKNKK